MAFLYRVGVLTISDRCSQGQAVDKSGPKLVEIVIERGLTTRGLIYWIHYNWTIINL